MKNSFIISFIAILLAVVLVVRIVSNEQKFTAEVKRSTSVSAGYDTEFINLVNRLEKELALRAQFGFKGKKDPLTGKRREIAEPATVAPMKIASIAVTPQGSSPTKPVEKPVQKVIAPTVRVTAIIFDDSKNSYTAMIMEGDRSLVLEVGDAFGRGKVTAITNGAVTVTDGQNNYTYDLRGQVKVSPIGQI